MDLADYLDEARQQTNAPSDRRLAALIGIDSASISAWRRGHGVPKDRHMVRLAKLANMDVKRALLDLNMWRSDDPDTVQHYAEIWETLKRVALVFPVTWWTITLDCEIEAHQVRAELSGQGGDYALCAFPASSSAALSSHCRSIVVQGFSC